MFAFGTYWRCFVILVTGVHPTRAARLILTCLDCRAESAYKVLDASDSLFDADNPAIYPAGTDDNKPVTVGITTTTVTADLGAVADMPIYGFRVTIAKRDLDLSYDAADDVYVPLASYNNKVFRYYTAADIADVDANDAVTLVGSTYTVTFADIGVGTYKVEVDTVNMDGSESVSTTFITTLV